MQSDSSSVHADLERAAQGDQQAWAVVARHQDRLRRTIALRLDQRLQGRFVKEEPPRPRQLDPAIPPDLETIVLKAVAKEPAARYAGAGEMAEDLRRFLADRPIQARRTRWVEHAWRWCRRNPGWAAAVAAVAPALVVITLSSILFSLNLQTALTRAQDAERVETDKLWEKLCARAHAMRDRRAVLTRNFDDFDDLHDLVVFAANGHHEGILVVLFDNNPRNNVTSGDIARAVRNLEKAGVSVADSYHELNHWP